MFPQTFGKYMLEAELSRGGMARVFLATLRGTSGFEKKLVVKQIRDELAHDEDFVDRFVTEAKTAVRLNHPNIVPVFELGVEQGVYFIAMELVRGVTIADLLKSEATAEARGRLSPVEGAYVGAELCKALDHAHRTGGVVHRDVTPRNVMIDEEGQVKVIDFGIAAKALASADGIFGSPGHMPPEQLRGDPPTARSDLFASAVLLLECWSGEPPFRRATVEASEKAMNAPHPKPSDSDPALAPLDDVITRAMQLDPNERLESAEDLGRELRRFIRETDAVDIARGLARKVSRALTQQHTRPETDAALERSGSSNTRAHHTQTFATRSIPDEPVPPADPKPVVETLATRPLETPVPKRPKEAPTDRSTRAWIAALVVLGTAAFLASRAFHLAETVDGASSTKSARDPIDERDEKATEPPQVVATAVATAPPDGTSPPAAPPRGTAPSLASAAPVSAPSHGATAGKPPDTSGPAKSAEASLSLACDPGTTAFVDGVRAACPGRGLPIGKGTHELRFDFAPTGETRSARVVVAEGESVTVRADFASAVPQVRISRP